MKQLFKPSKITWIVFVLLVASGVSSPFVGLFLSILTDWLIFDYLYFIALYQAFGLFVLAEGIGIDVTAGGGGELFSNPNILGWLLVGGSIIVSLFIHYTIASFISRVFFTKRENSNTLISSN